MKPSRRMIIRLGGDAAIILEQVVRHVKQLQITKEAFSRFLHLSEPYMYLVISCDLHT